MKAICQSMSIRSEEYRQHCAINNDEEEEEEVNIYCSQSKRIDAYGRPVDQPVNAGSKLVDLIRVGAKLWLMKVFAQPLSARNISPADRIKDVR